jgi:hypothetical protein
VSLLDLLRRRRFQPSKHRGLLAADDSLLELEGYEDDPDEERPDIARLAQVQWRSYDRNSIFRERWLYRNRDVSNERPGWPFAFREVHADWALEVWREREGTLNPPAPWQRAPRR